MADTSSKSLFVEAMVREVDETFGSGIDKLEETIADQNAKIGERIHALLLLLRSRNPEEENLQVNARPASPQLSESPDFNRPEPKPNYGVNVTPDAPNASSLLSNRKYKIQRRISCEEIDERRLKGLCVFCEEPETPNHHLQHKNSGILMIDSEDHLSNAEEIGVEISSDMWLSNSYGCELETGETDYDEDQDRFLIDSDLVENEVAKDAVKIDVEVASDDDKFLDAAEVYGFNVEACETDSLIEQNELIQEQDENHSTDSVLEPSFVQHMCSPLKHQSLFDLGITTRGARQVFDTIPTRREVLSKGHKTTFHKSWRFKFKAKSQPRELIQGEPWIQELKKNKLHSTKKQRKCHTSWMFTNKLMKKNKFSKTWFMLKGDCFKEDDQVYHETLPIWLLTRFKFGKFRSVNMNFQKTKPQIEDVMGEDRKKQPGDSEHDTKVFETLKDLQQFTLGEVMFQIKHKWRDDQVSVEKTLVKAANTCGEDLQQLARVLNVRCLRGFTFGISESDARLGEQSVYDRIILVKEQLLQTSLVIQEVMRNEKIKFSNRWWFKYKFGEAGLTRQSSSNLYMTYYFAVWHCWKNKTMVCVEMSGEHWSWMVLDRKSATSSFLLFLYDQRMGVPGQGYNFILYRDHQGRCRLKQSKCLIQGELVKTGKLSKLRLKKHHMSQYLWKSWCSTVLYKNFLWEHSDKGTQLLCSRRLVVYKLGSEAKNVVPVSQRVYWTVEQEFSKVERKLEVTQSQTFDPGIGLESQETLRRTMEETTWELPLFCSDNFQTLNLVVKVLRTGEI
ncbi:hypothetical protein ISN45_Aa03g016530 [Arabidopsis thaliana x Arabidopsis arenosa]|uniref:Uncharacterized protein n=1 Tax=Arabidopsis thaliana x Arabidopsis arenosa TaxID=1240361 RepID=A0A8T2AX76_9BRAS|nr:hypothetical protein ISN45_Aa03g016530 [Arabidopsis thaliana x Arabidopsis arenosa]